MSKICHWICSKCLADALPFCNDNFEPEETPVSKPSSIPNVHMEPLISDLNTIVNQCQTDDTDLDLRFHSVDCKYYECHDFTQLVSDSKVIAFSSLHLNIASLSKHFDEFNALLAQLQHKFSVIGVSETRLRKGIPAVLNLSIHGYSAVYTPTESSAGGVLLYISSKFSSWLCL